MPAQHKNIFSQKTFIVAAGRTMVFRLVSQKCTLQIKKKKVRRVIAMYTRVYNNLYMPRVNGPVKKKSVLRIHCAIK